MQGQAEQVSKSKNKLLATTYKHFSRSLYTYRGTGVANSDQRENHSNVGNCKGTLLYSPSPTSCFSYQVTNSARGLP